MSDGSGLAEALLGLDGFRVLAVSEIPAELVIEVETTADFVGCSTCGQRAEAQDRMTVELRDLPCFGRTARLVWRKRRWRCRDSACPARTWTETSYLKATSEHPTIYATGLVDLEGKKLIDLVEGNRAADLRGWLAGRDERWLKGVKVVATDLAESFRAGLSPHLAHAKKVADPFHVVRVGNRCVDKVRRRVQNETLGHRGRKEDPLYRIRKLLLTGDERLNEKGKERMLLGLRVGDPHDEVLGAWLAKESVRDVYLTEDVAEATVLLDKAITGCLADDVGEIRSLGGTLRSWRKEILEHHRTEASNGPTEGLNLCVKKVKRCGHGYLTFENYRLRVLLHTGGVTWPDRPKPPRIRTRAPHSNA